MRADDPDGWQRLGITLAAWLEQRGDRRVAVVCIGTDRSTGDALGPLVGTLLDRSGLLPRDGVLLMGTLDEPVHAGNLDQAVARLAALGPGTTVLAVDACLGRSENVGSISAGRGALQPGAGVNKSLPAVGHLFVTGTVNVGGFMEYFVLQNTRLGLVLRMAEAIASGIGWALACYLDRTNAAGAPRPRTGDPAAARAGPEDDPVALRRPGGARWIAWRGSLEDRAGASDLPHRTLPVGLPGAAAAAGTSAGGGVGDAGTRTAHAGACPATGNAPATGACTAVEAQGEGRVRGIAFPEACRLRPARG